MYFYTSVLNPESIQNYWVYLVRSFNLPVSQITTFKLQWQPFSTSWVSWKLELRIAASPRAMLMGCTQGSRLESLWAALWLFMWLTAYMTCGRSTWSMKQSHGYGQQDRYFTDIWGVCLEILNQTKAIVIILSLQTSRNYEYPALLENILHVG